MKAGISMSSIITIRNLPDDTKERLKEQAKLNGRSLEAQVRWILEWASKQNIQPIEDGIGKELGFGSRLRNLVVESGAYLTADDLPKRDEYQRAVDL
jgi:plasmid stability protein